MHEKSIFLTGFMGAGKSTVAVELAAILGWRAVDSDALIEMECGATVREIFASRGEAEFRVLEKKTVEALLGQSALVVSLGGGALIDADSLSKLKRRGHLVYLAARPATLEARLRSEAEQRPLIAGLTVDARIERIKSLLESRQASYHQADLTIETDMLNPNQIALEIADKLWA